MERASVAATGEGAVAGVDRGEVEMGVEAAATKGGTVAGVDAERLEEVVGAVVEDVGEVGVALATLLMGVANVGGNAVGVTPVAPRRPTNAWNKTLGGGNLAGDSAARGGSATEAAPAPPPPQTVAASIG